MSARLAVAIFVVVAVVHLVAQGVGSTPTASTTQVLLMPALVAVVLNLRAAPYPRMVRLLLVGLGFSFVGDALPRLLTGDAAFLAMMGSFLLAQIAYIAAFLPDRGRSVAGRRRWLLLPYLVAVGALVWFCASGAGPLLIPVLLYGACLGTMAVLATGVNTVTAIGGALFLISDGLIALDAFAVGYHLPLQGLAVMATYLVAQVLLVVGVLRRTTEPTVRP